MRNPIIKRAVRTGLFIFICIQFMGSISFGQTKQWPKNVTIAGGTIGGAVFLYSGGLAKILYEKMGISASVEVTGGSVHNVKLINSNEVTFGPSQAPSVYDGWNGLDWAKGVKHQNLRAVFHQNNTYLQIYCLKKSGIKSVYDLSGKRFGVGPIGGGPHVYLPKILTELGIKPSRFVNASHSDIQSQLKDGLVDASVSITGVPWVVIKEIETVHEVNVFGVSGKELQKTNKFVEQYPFVSIGAVPKGTYKSNKDHDVETITFGSFYYAHKDTPDDFVYEVLKKIFENIDYLIVAHPSAKEARHENIVYAGIPIHPGAVKYYKEKGIKIPNHLIPSQ